MKSAQLVAVAALAIFAMAGCGSSSPAPTTTATPTPTPTRTTNPAPTQVSVDMCALFTPADLRAVTGGTYTDPGVSSSLGQCSWSGGGTGVTSGHSLVIATIGDNPLAGYKRDFPGGVDLTVSGHAGYWNAVLGFKAMWVDFGPRTLLLMIDPAGPDGQAVAQEMAEIAVANM